MEAAASARGVVGLLGGPPNRHRGSRQRGNVGRSTQCARVSTPHIIADDASPMRPLATIGYEGATVQGFLDALRAERIELLVDVRAVAMSRRPGFAITTGSSLANRS